MRVNVLCFGVLKDCLGSGRDALELADGSRVGRLMELLRERGAAHESVWSSLAVAVNREYAGVETVLRDGDEVALLPPVSGGAGSSRMCEMSCGAPIARAGRVDAR